MGGRVRVRSSGVVSVSRGSLIRGAMCAGAMIRYDVSAARRMWGGGLSREPGTQSAPLAGYDGGGAVLVGERGCGVCNK